MMFSGDKTSASGLGGMGFKSQADQTSHALRATHHRCNLAVSPGTKKRKWASLTLNT